MERIQDQDREAKTAKQLLAEFFRELDGEKNIDKITIKEITDHCGYSPATFYRHFKDKYDLIAWEYAGQAEEIMNRIGQSDYEWKQTLLDAARHFREEKDYLTNLLMNTTGHDSFIQYMTQINADELEKYIRKSAGMKELDQRTRMYIRLYCMGTVCLTCEWILGKYQVSPEELAGIFENSIPDPLRPYLLSKPVEGRLLPQPGKERNYIRSLKMRETP